MLRAMFALVGVVVTVIGLPVLAANAPQQKVDDQRKVSPNDWPWWRGPTRNGVAVADQNLPPSRSDTAIVIWNAPIPARGHASPTAVGDQVFLAAA